MAEMQGLEFEIKGNVDKAIASVNKLKKALGGLQIGNIKGLGRLAGDIRSIGSAASKLNKAAPALRKLAEEARGLGTATPALREFTAAMSELAEIDFTNLTAAAAALREIADSMRNISSGGKRFSLKDLFSTDRLSGNDARPVLYLLDTLRVGLIGALKGIASAVKTVGGIVKSVISWTLQALKKVVQFLLNIPKLIKTAVVSAFNRLKDSITNVTNKMKEWYSKSILLKPLRDATEHVRSLVQTLLRLGKTIARIAFMRGIRTLVKQLGAGFREGLGNLYAWSALFGGQFAQSMDRLATSATYLKNSIAAMSAPIINALAPAIDFVIDKVVALLNVINQLFARLTGASYWTKATKQAVSYGDAASGAGSAAKEAMRYLAPFDELNVLPSDNGGGSGGGSGGAGGSGMFEEMMEFDNAIKDFADSLKEAWEAGDWQGVGTVIADKLNWLIDEYIDWPGLGSKFGSWINAIVSSEYWTLEQTHFNELGAGVARMINSALEEIDADVWGRLITRKLTAALDFAIGYIQELDAGQVGKKINDFFVGMFTEWSEWLQSQNGEELATTIRTKVSELFTGLNIGEIISSAMTAGGDFTKLVSDFIRPFVSEFKTWFDTTLKGENWQETAQNILSYIGSGFGSIASWVDKNFITPFMDAVGLGSYWENIKSVGTTIMNKIKDGFPTFSTWVDTNIIQPIKSAMNGESSWSDVGSNIAKALKDGLPNFWNWTKTNVVDPMMNAIIGEDNWKSIQSFFKSLPDKLSSVTSSLHNFFKGVGSDIADGLADGFSKKYHDSTFGKIMDILLGTGDASEAWAGLGGPTFEFKVPEGWLPEDQNYKIPVTADVTGLELNLSDEQKKINGMTGKIGSTDSSDLPSSQKLIKNITAQLSGWQRGWGSSSTYNLISIKASLPSWQRGSKWYSQGWDKISLTGVLTKLQAGSSVNNYKVTLTKTATGGAFYGGSWHDIPQYASGTLNAGSMFIAGEAGPELVGHIGGRTEVLNASQIASAIAAGVAGASYSYDAQGMSEEMLYNAFVRALNDTDSGDIYLDGEAIYRSVRKHNDMNTRMTGVNAFA